MLQQCANPALIDYAPPLAMASCDEEQLSSESAAGAGVQPAEKSLDLVETAVDKIPDVSENL